MIALGSVRIPDVAGAAAEAFEPVWQMSQSRFCGEATIELEGGVAQVRARISEALAATKVGKGVYRGFSLALLQGADNSTRIARIALVDSPDAVTKGTSAEFLKISRKPFAMTKTSVLVQADQVRLMCREARDRKSEAARIGKAMGNPLPCPPTRAGEAQHNGLSTTAGGRGRDQAGYGQDQGSDTCMDSIRRMLAQPYREGEGLLTMLRSRAA